jgi:hypothetical protein
VGLFAAGLFDAGLLGSLEDVRFLDEARLLSFCPPSFLSSPDPDSGDLIVLRFAEDLSVFPDFSVPKEDELCESTVFRRDSSMEPDCCDLIAGLDARDFEALPDVSSAAAGMDPRTVFLLGAITVPPLRESKTFGTC